VEKTEKDGGTEGYVYIGEFMDDKRSGKGR
jgi:hypothetical protein